MNQLEKDNIYVYNKISKHFDKTRGYQWKCIKNFLNEIVPYTTILDVGCGNGRNMVDKRFIFDGCDASENLVEICQNKGLNVINSDCCNLPYNDNSYDYVMNIAVLHHLSTKERRVQCVNELKRVCKTKGKIIITVWSWEFYKNKYENKDAFVDWPLHKRFTETGNKDELYTRYYHFFEKNEIINLIKNINNLNIVDIYFEHENWIIILEKI